MAVIYLVTLAAASGLTGVTVQRILAAQGYAPTFEMQTALTLTAASGFAALQFAHTALMRTLAPTKHGSLFLAESFSHAAALLLLPPMLGYTLPRPDFLAAGPELWTKAQPLLFLAAFLTLHAALKLAVFFTALQAPAAGRLGAITWLLLACAAGVASRRYYQDWTSALRHARPEAPTAAETTEVNGVRTRARLVPEGAALTVDCSGRKAAQSLTFWLGPPVNADRQTPAKAHVVFEFPASGVTPHEDAITLAQDGWTRVHIPANELPEDTRACRITWTSESPPPWNRYTDLRPVTASDNAIALSGPHPAAPGKEGPPNMVIIAIDGLSAAALPAFGAEEGVTPSLDRFAGQCVAFPEGLAPSRGSASSLASLLTGESPLVHGLLGANPRPMTPGARPLPAVLRGLGYLTGGFLETSGEAQTAAEALTPGFAYLDTRFEPGGEDLSPSAATLERMLEWIEANQDARYLAVARLTELARGSVAPETRGAEFQETLKALDLRLGAFIKQIRDSETGPRTCIAVAGLPREDGPARAPLFIRAPGRPAETRTAPVSLIDLYPTLCATAGALPGQDWEDRILFRSGYDQQPVRVSAPPFTLLTRTEGWWVEWTPGGDPFSFAGQTGGRARLWREADGRRLDRSGEHPEFTGRWVEWLAEWAASELRRREALSLPPAA